MVDSPFGNGPDSLTPPGQPQAPSGPDLQAPDMGRSPAQVPPGTPQVNIDSNVNFASPTPTPEPHPQAVNADALSSDEHASLTSYSPATGQPGTPPGIQQGDFQGGLPTDVARNMSMGHNPQEKLQILNKVFGEGNSFLDKNQDLWFRKEGETSFQPATPSVMDAVGSAIGGDPSGVQALFNTHFQGINEIAHQTAAAITGGIVGEAAMGAPGRILGEAVLSGGAAFYDSLNRAKTVSKLLDNKFDSKSAEANALTDAEHMALVTGGLGIAASSISKVSDLMLNAVKNSAINRVNAAQTLRNTLVNYAKSFSTTPLDQIGSSLKGALADASNPATLSDQYLYKWKTTADNYLEGTQTRVDVSPVLANIKKTLGPWVKFNGDSPAGPIGGIDYSATGDFSPSQVAMINQRTGGNVPGAFDEMFRPLAPLGMKGGTQTTNQLLQTYNDLLEAQKINGGLPYEVFNRKMEETGSLITDWEALDKQLYPSKDKQLYKNLYGSFIDSRDQLMNQVLGGDQAAFSAYKKDFASYKAMRDNAESLFSIFGKDNVAPGLVVDQAMNSNDPQVIHSLRALVGDDPQINASLKSGAIQNMIKKSIDLPNVTGLFNPKAFKQIYGGYNGELLKSIFSPEEIGQLRKFAVTSGEINVSDMVSSTSQQAVKDAANLAVGAAHGGLSPNKQAQFLYGLMSGNDKAYRFLTNNAIPDLLQEAKISKDFGRLNTLTMLKNNLLDYRFLSEPVEGTGRFVPGEQLKQIFRGSAKQTMINSAAHSMSSSTPSKKPFPIKGRLKEDVLINDQSE